MTPQTTLNNDTTTAAAFNLVELTLISAQDLFPSPRSLHTYAVTFLHPSHRLRTRLDSANPNSPTWNDKFLFRVDHSTLHSDTSAIQINIYSSRPRFLPGPDTLLGTARAILSTLHLSSSTRFLALQIRRPASLRPQGILNVGIGIVSPYFCALPLYANIQTSAFAYHDLMRADVSKKTRKKGKINAAPPRPPPTMEGSVIVLDRSGSLGGAGEKEGVVLEGKLKKWRSEIWASDDDDVGTREMKMRRPRAMSCFNLAGQFAGDVGDDDDDNSSRSSWSSSNR